MKSISIIALEKAIEELEQRKTAAVRSAAKPYDDKIADLRKDIAILSGVEVPQSLTFSQPVYKKKRGRKPKLYHSLVYPIKGTIIARLLYTIKEIGRFATINEIATIVHTYEPAMSNDSIKEKFGKHINKYKDKGLLISYKIGSRRNTVYGLPEWFENGKPLIERQHDVNALIDKVLENQEIELVE